MAIKQLTSEEMEVLNRATEIVSKYVGCGILKETDFQQFEKMIVSIIDGVPDDIKAKGDENLFSVVRYRDGVLIDKYIGFDEKDILIPDTISGKKVLAIGEKAFYKADHIISVSIPDTVISIGNACFSGCERLEKVKLSNNLKAIDSYAFYETIISTLIMPDSLFYVGTAAFAKTKIEKVVISKALTVISSRMFWCCECLRDVYVPESVYKIADMGFSDCSNLKKITLPAGLEEIEKEGFCNCSELKAIDIPDSVLKIGTNAFSGRYTYQPDRRYNPRTTYRNMDIVIRCNPGTMGQQYARDHSFSIEKTQMEFKVTDNRRVKVYTAEKYDRYSYSFLSSSKTMDEETEKTIIETLHQIDGMCDCVKLNEKDICVKSESDKIAELADRRDTNNGIRIRKI